jgi:DNA-binding beta-propeller fold protein YncE
MFAVMVLVMLATEPAAALSVPVTISYGRSWPLSIVVDSSRGVAYVDGTSGIYPPTGFSFGVINTTSYSLLKVLPLNSTPGAISLDPSSGDVYVAGSGSIEIFRWRTQAFSKSIQVGHPILSIVYDNGSGSLLFTSGDSVFAIDATTGQLRASSTVGGDAEGMVVDAKNGEVYVTSYLLGTISVLKAGTLTMVKTIGLPSPAYPSQLALDPNTQLIYATTGTNSIDVIDARTDTFVRAIQVAPSSRNSTTSVALDSKTGRVFAASSPGGSITEVDGLGGAVVGGFKLSSAVYALAVDQKKGELYATNYHQISVFDVRGGQPNLLPVWLAATLGAAAAAVVFFLLVRRRSRGQFGASRSESPHKS